MVTILELEPENFGQKLRKIWKTQMYPGRQSGLVGSELDSRPRDNEFESRLIQYARWKWYQMPR